MKTEKVGLRIRTFMTRQDMSLETLAQRTGLETGFLSTIIEDDVYPSLGPLLKIARALDVRLGTFLDDQISDDPLVARIPRHVAFVDSFPLAASGKVQKYKLQEQSANLFPDPGAG